MVERTLFLHIGPPKTGTSAFQRVACAQPLTSALYPRTGRWADGAHHHLALAAAGKTMRGAVSVRPLHELQDELARETLQAERDVVVSSEALHAKIVPGFLDTYAKAFSAHQPRVIAVLRNPLRRLASVYNQHVKDGAVRETRHPDAFLRQEIRRSDPVAWLNGLEKMGVPFEVVPYEPADTIVSRLCELTGLEPLLGGAVRANRSLSGPGLLVHLALNRAGVGGAERAATLQRLARQVAFWGEAPFPFSAAAVAEFSDTLGPRFAEVGERLGLSSVLNEQPSTSLGVLDEAQLLDAIADALPLHFKGVADLNDVLAAAA